MIDKRICDMSFEEFEAFLKECFEANLTEDQITQLIDDDWKHVIADD